MTNLAVRSAAARKGARVRAMMKAARAAELEETNRMKLRAPDPNASFSYGGATYQAGKDCLVEIPDHFAHLAHAHGYTAWIEPIKAEPMDVFDAMKREELFTFLRDHNVRAQPPITGAQLRALCRQAAAKMRENEDAPETPEEPAAPEGHEPFVEIEGLVPGADPSAPLEPTTEPPPTEQPKEPPSEGADDSTNVIAPPAPAA